MRTKKGYTLVELMVVVTIIMALIAILMPALHKARRLAKLATCGSNQHQVMVAMAAYAAASNGVMPYCGAWFNFPQMLNLYYDPVGGGLTPDGFINLGLLQSGGYIDRRADVLFCPLQTGESYMQSNGYNRHVNALPNVDNGQTPLPADAAKFGWVNKYAGFARRNFHEASAYAVVDMMMLKRIALIADVISSPGAVTASHGDGVNAAFTDLSVAARPVNASTIPATFTQANNGYFDNLWADFDN